MVNDGLTRFHMTLTCDIAEVARVLDTMEAFGEAHALSGKLIFQVNLALDELITNIISYGFDEGAVGRIDLDVVLQGDKLRAELSDNGRAFDPTKEALPEIGGGLDDRDIGGLGLRFVRTYMERLDYRRDGGLNHLYMEMKASVAD